MRKIFFWLLFSALIIGLAGLVYLNDSLRKENNQIKNQFSNLQEECSQYRAEIEGCRELNSGNAYLTLASLLIEDSRESVKNLKIIFKNFDYNKDQTAYMGYYWLVLEEKQTGKVLDEMSLNDFGSRMFMDPYAKNEEVEKLSWNLDPVKRKPIGLVFAPDKEGEWSNLKDKSLIWIYFDSDLFPRPVSIEGGKIVMYQ